jgi:hypothetical protein
VRFNFKTRKWSEVVADSFDNWAASLDAKYLYYATGGAEPMARRVRLSDGKVETITSLRDLRRVVDPVEYETQISVAPDASAVFARDIGTQEIYALTLNWP